MARYNREFLIPYLQDIYALYMAKRKIDAERNKVWLDIKKQREMTPQLPPKPKRISVDAEAGTVSSFFGVIILGLGITLSVIIFALLMSVIGEPHILELLLSRVFLGIVFIDLVLYAVAVPFLIYARRKDKIYYSKQKMANDEYRKKYEEYENQCNDIVSQGQMCVKQMENQLAYWGSERDRVDDLINRAFQANVIPSHYRNVYAIVYLYDYFSSSQEDDLVMALNTYLLEQIKDKLDILINQQAEMILNQYVMIGNQERQMEQIKNHHDQLCQKLDDLNLAAEEQLAYLSMIECNEETIAYFTAAEYLDRI